MRRVSYVTCHVPHVMCHLSLTPTASATNPLPANSPTLNSMLVLKVLKKKRQKKEKTNGIGKNQKRYRYTNISNTFFDHKSPVHWGATFPDVDWSQTEGKSYF